MIVQGLGESLTGQLFIFQTYHFNGANLPIRAIQLSQLFQFIHAYADHTRAFDCSLGADGCDHHVCTLAATSEAVPGF